MAKKRKASRSSAAKGAKKKKTVRAKKAVKRAVAPAHRTGLEDPRQVDFRPLKKQIAAHIARLDSARDMTPAVESAIRALRQVQVDLSGHCSPTMILPTA